MGYFAGILSGIIVFYLYKEGKLSVIFEEGKKLFDKGKKLYNKVLYK
jgi:hypothetical protein